MTTFDKPIVDAALKIYSSRPAILNILDVIHSNENAHTRFLCQLLNYKMGSIPVFLKSFLKRLASDSPLALDEHDYLSAKAEEQTNYIDCLIKCGKHAIIIENKVCGACDQCEQIASYVEKVKGSCRHENIYVVYLTLFGGEPSKSSLPDELRTSLGRRYVALTYRDDILPWLEEDVLPMCPYKDNLLIGSLKLYINYLKGALGERPEQKALAEQLAKTLECNWDKESYSRLKNMYQQYSDSENGAEGNDRYSDIRALVNILLREIEKRCPYVNEDNVAYVLKWMFRNDPPWPYKFTWVDGSANVAPYSSRTFMYGGERYIGLSKDGVQIHLRCSVGGIGSGPYILVDGNQGHIEGAEGIFGKQYLKDRGLDCSKGSYHLPFNEFTEKTPLSDVAFHVKKLVDILNGSPCGKSY